MDNQEDSGVSSLACREIQIDTNEDVSDVMIGRINKQLPQSYSVFGNGMLMVQPPNPFHMQAAKYLFIDNDSFSWGK
jgi:hypothetical protein